MNTTTRQMLEQLTAPEESSLPMPSAMLIVAHPDDEVIAVGARIRRFRDAHFVHVTDGAPRNGNDSRNHGFPTLEGYRQARREEFRGALREAGLVEASYECLGIPDQEASLHLIDLQDRIATLIKKYRPKVVLTHPYEGGHPDHDACAFAVHQAVHKLKELNMDAPLVIEACYYHAGTNGIETGCFLSSAEPEGEIVYDLTPPERMQKQRLLQCFTTQQSTLQYFSTAQERFRIAPRYDFTKPAHQPPVFYDRHPWGMSSQRFCELASEAMDAEREEAGTQ